ncbi:Spy0128 family protein [Eggerthia catenaformis]|uniref:DUF7601 domain-containing protein n=1 Tax=Eggerthia catenaformis TaxID=31973 RepID=UPI0028EDBB59|nr:DUF5979 domain-containing protein [Eggerthia catenaformis]
MKNRIFKSIVAAGMIFSMAAPIMNVNATQDYPKNVTIKKVIEKEARDFAPNTTFKFQISAGTASANGEIYAGPDGGVTFTDNEIKSVPKADDIGKTTLNLTDTATLKINESVFTKPGRYRYEITEVNDGYEGMKYDTSSKHFDVFVDTSKHAYSYAFVNDNNTKDEGIFKNTYKRGQDGVNELTVKKSVTGNIADRTKKFRFTININGAAGEMYAIYQGNEKKGEVTSNSPTTFELADNESFTITGLSKSDKYTITEDDYSADGYTTTDRINTGTVVNENKEIIVVNNKNSDIPTGIIMTYLPYILLVAAAGAIFVLFNKRRDHSEL